MAVTVSWCSVEYASVISLILVARINNDRFTCPFVTKKSSNCTATDQRARFRGSSDSLYPTRRTHAIFLRQFAGRISH